MLVLELARVDIVTRGFLTIGSIVVGVTATSTHFSVPIIHSWYKSSKALCFPCSWFVTLSSCTSSSVTFSDSSIALCSNGLWVISFAYMPTPPDYPRVSRIQSQSPSIPYGWPNSRIKGSLDQLPTKNYDLSSICFKIPKSSGFLCLYYGLWLHFPAWGTLFVASKKNSFSSLLLYKRESD